MEIYENPSDKSLKIILARPLAKQDNLVNTVLPIINNVKKNGDKALKQYALKFDGANLNSLKIADAEIKNAERQVDVSLKKAIKTAFQNISKFHSSQKLKESKIETTPGVLCWRESRPIEKVGLYIPGGSAPLFSTVLMLAIPASIAGCKKIILCTPCNKNGEVNPAILYAASLCDVSALYKVGGAQAIAAMAFGTKTIPAVNKIFGPGNQYVTLAKQILQQNGVAIDMPAGPSEVMVVADGSANASFVAADLLSQAEHGTDSQVILVTWQKKLAQQVIKEVEKQLKDLPRQNIAAASLKHSKIILVKNRQRAIEVINAYAPEHLILAVKEERFFIANVLNAGSVFIGNYTPESAGDYASGTNHTLPTNGYAKAYSGVSLDSFVKKITFQKISAQGLKNLGNTIELMAAAEQLQAHKNAVTIRLQKLNSSK